MTKLKNYESQGSAIRRIMHHDEESEENINMEE